MSSRQCCCVMCNVEILIVVVVHEQDGRKSSAPFYRGNAHPPTVANHAINAFKLNRNSVNWGCRLSQH